MKMLMLVYSGADPRRISSVLDDHHAGGYTEFDGVHGSGATGRREGSRAWPGESTLFVSVVPTDAVPPLTDTLRSLSAALPPGERLHVAVMPTETFF
ncbi:MAG TPA: hypothetical protein VFT96_11110 [Gemmatimonadaceae bacterium]|nr:hypothetical protein [Gemmatimonadaceae bacterium]